MTATETTHHFSESICSHLGAPCPAMRRMLRALAGALEKAKPLTEDDFEICGASELDGCNRQCPARFFATHDRIRVFCGVSAEGDRSGLDRFANSLLSPDAVNIPTGRFAELPCAFGEAVPFLATHQPPQVLANLARV